MARVRNKDRMPRRGGPFLQPRDRILVLCCGTTEVEYFKAFVQNIRNPSVTVKVKEGKVSAPLGLANEGSSLPDRENYDQVWCVADVDQFDVSTVHQAVEKSHGLELALSNPCFELWLLLHFREWNRHEDTCQKLGDRVRKHVPTYNKHIEFHRFDDGVPMAVERAKRMRGTGHPPRNPSTTVWRVIEAISKGGGETPRIH